MKSPTTQPSKRSLSSKTIERNAAIERLKKWLPPGAQVFCIVRKVAASGMSRNIQVVYFDTNDDGTVDDRHPTHSIALAIGQKTIRNGNHDTIRMTGCGFDACEALINEHLSYTLYGKPNAFRVRTL